MIGLPVASFTVAIVGITPAKDEPEMQKSLES